MGTRGTAIIIDEENISIGPEFNGDMYPHGYGDDFMNKLSEVKNNVEFIIFNSRFNKYNFGYDEIMKCYQGKFPKKDIIDDNKYSVNIITQKNGKWVTSDWLFIKNITKKQIKIKDVNDKTINLNSNETIRLYFGQFIQDSGTHRIK